LIVCSALKPDTIPHGREENQNPEKFEEAFERLEEIVARLESGDVALEESLDLYTRA